MLKTKAIRLAGLGALAVVLAAGIGCSSNGVAKADYDKVQQQLKDKTTEAQKLQEQIAAQAKAAPAGDTKGAAGVTTLLGAVKKTPAPSPSPTPAGQTATPAPPKETPPAAFYQKLGDYFIYMETLATTTASKYNIASNVACTPSGTFKRGQRIVFRYDIVNMATGMRVTDKDAGAVVKVVLPNGDEAVGRFGQRSGGKVPGAPFMWSSNWDIPENFPLGGIDYKVVITQNGKTFTWTPPSLVSKESDSRPKVFE